MRGRLARLVAIALSFATCSATTTIAAPTRAWLDAPLGYLLRTDDELGVDVALLLRVVGQLTADARAVEVSEIRRLGFAEAKLDRIGPLFELELPALAPAIAPAGPRDPAPLPPRPVPPTRLTLDGRRANAATCVERAAACELGPGCIEWVTYPEAAGLDLTHQAVWLLFVRWRGCATPSDLDLDALQASLAGRLLGELRAENRYSEVHLERLATLGQLGYADLIEPSSIRTVLGAQTPAGCWGGAIGAECHPHPTALAIWVLALAERAGHWP